MDETKIDRAAMGRLARALAFICGPEHATTVALRTAAETGSEQDINCGCPWMRIPTMSPGDSGMKALSIPT